MENFSIKSYSAQLRIYSGSADPPKSKISVPVGGETSSKTLSKTETKASDLQSKDGDSFSLSLEARIVQISMTQTDDGERVSKGEESAGTGLVKTLMQALGNFLGNDSASPTSKTDPTSLESQGKPTHLHPGLHRPMGNPEDVASKVLQHLLQEHAERGGSLQAFVDDIQKKMENRREAGSRKTDGFSDFRIQVDSLITSGLTAWSQSGGQALNIQA